MIDMVTLKSAMLERLKNLYQKGYKFYGIEVIEGYEKPSFHTQLVPTSLEFVNQNQDMKSFDFSITYFQKKADEADALEKATEIRNAFGLTIPVENRFIKVDSFDFDFVGDHNNIPQYTVSVSFCDDTPIKKPAKPLAKEIITKIRTEVR